jgi:hypothetical protein
MADLIDCRWCSFAYLADLDARRGYQLESWAARIVNLDRGLCRRTELDDGAQAGGGLSFQFIVMNLNVPGFYTVYPAGVLLVVARDDAEPCLCGEPSQNTRSTRDSRRRWIHRRRR